MAMDPGEKRKELYTKGIVRLGSRRGTYDMKLYPLVTHSVCIRRHVDSICEEKSILLIIELPACPGGPDIFRTVEDFCYGLMNDNAISIANVVDLIVTSNFLEMDGLACRALEFLEDNVFNSWESCLRVLANFDCNHRSNTLEGADENSIFRKCKRAFLRNVKIPLMYSKSSTGTMCCNVKCLLRAAELLSPRAAEDIYDSCRSEQLGLCFSYEGHDNTESDYVMLRSWFQIPLCIHFKGGPVFTVKFYSLSADGNHGAKWMEDLRNLIPIWSRRATLVLHLAKSMLLGDDVKAPTGPICLSRFRWSFLCALLDETTRLRVHAEERSVEQDLDEVIGKLQRMVSQGLHDVVFWNSKTDCILGDGNSDWSADLNCSFILKHLKRFSFNSLQLVLRQFKSLGSNHLIISALGRVVDSLVRGRLHVEAFTVQQAFSIYQEFPNDERLSHVGLYHVFHNLSERRVLSAQDACNITKLFDYQKLSDEIVEELFEEFRIGCDPRLLQRFLVIQDNRIKKESTHQKVINMRQDLELRIANFLKVRNEMSVESADLIKITQDKLHAESYLEDVVRDLEAEKEKTTLAERKLEENEKTILAAENKLAEAERDLDAEKAKTTCQICFTRPRDVLSLPCMHFLYCSDCLELSHQKKRICPACRGCTSGILKCSLSA